MKDVIDEIIDAIEKSGGEMTDRFVAPDVYEYENPRESPTFEEMLVEALRVVVEKRWLARNSVKANLATIVPMTSDQWLRAMSGEWVEITDTKGVVRGKVRESGFRVQFEPASNADREWIHAYAAKAVATDGASLNLVGVFEAF